jgi:hypothetical protein
MRIRTFTAAIGIGGVFALGAGFPVAQAKTSHHSTSLSAQTASRLEAQGLAQADAMNKAAERARVAKILKASGWSTEGQYYQAFGGR